MVSHAVMQLIEATTTRAGLTVNIKLDKPQYRTNLEVSAEEMASVNLERHAFHGEWTYTMEPSQLVDGPATQGLLVSPHLSPLIG